MIVSSLCFETYMRCALSLVQGSQSPRLPMYPTCLFSNSFFALQTSSHAFNVLTDGFSLLEQLNRPSSQTTWLKGTTSTACFIHRHLLLQLSCPCRQIQLCNPILSSEATRQTPLFQMVLETSETCYGGHAINLLKQVGLDFQHLNWFWSQVLPVIPPNPTDPSFIQALWLKELTALFSQCVFSLIDVWRVSTAYIVLFSFPFFPSGENWSFGPGGRGGEWKRC
eukprot:1156688-Pelagomonas_calceolata.AAC.3